MSKIKTSVSLTPEAHARVKAMAERDRRTLGNFLEIFIEKLADGGDMGVEAAKKSSPAAMMGMSLAA